MVSQFTQRKYIALSFYISIIFLTIICHSSSGGRDGGRRYTMGMFGAFFSPHELAMGVDRGGHASLSDTHF